ncbi:conserved hypothetical protein [Streptomyces himastatinicus ATCC 53653]|uniref:Mycothiol-dependent maleylpyruvate isomerase metal-binding domain-containing protein n=2 Tax=Streptomyces violaceusniger group TaxID=2839105 RepID=D9W793_9ACTN|nr:conserved hypothetical protein [Streptomyces himastatinicus ATCC 53653]
MKRMETTGNIRDAIAAERRELADLLDDLTPHSGTHPSLCAGVAGAGSRDAHVPGSATAARTLARLSAAAAARMTDRLARADAATASTAQLAAYLRDNAHHPWKPPVGGLTAALGHDVIHGLDITVALGLDRRVPEDRIRTLLDTIDARTLKFFGADLTGIQLRADDLDWSYGTGTPLTGAAQDLLLLAYGRKLPPGRLHGEAGGRFVTA